MDGTAGLSFRLLGPFEVYEGERELLSGGGKQHAVLAILLLTRGGYVSSERLADELWGERPPASAAKSVQVYVSHLRKALGSDVIVTRGNGYELAVAPETVDVRQFEQLAAEGREALAAGDPETAVRHLQSSLSLWRGPALADFAYESFAQSEIVRLDELRLAAIEDWIEAELELGRHRSVVGEIEALVTAHPLRERLRGQLMLALYRSGRQAEALAAYQDARRALVDELGIEPTPELQRLEQRILRQESDLELGDAAHVTPGHPEPRPAADVPPRLLPGQREDELRPTTILFADVVGSTALGERLPPDEVKALIGECVTMMSHAVEEYGGSVQAYQGDGICAYFGVPKAHEDDPERAARAGLRILEVVGEYARDIEAAWGLPDFAVRIGINSGQTAVGLVGGERPGEVALGDATNLAARLQSAAEPGTIVVGETVSRRLSTRFTLEPLGLLDVKGRDESVTAFRLLGAKARERIVPAEPIIGRDEEVLRLSAALGELLAGRGRVVILFGDPGIGKTRLLEELHKLAGESVTWLEGRCLSYGGLASWPLIEALLGWLGADIGEPEIALRTKARAKLGALLGPSEADRVLVSLGRLLRLRLGPEGGAVDIAAGYLRWLEGLSAEKPLVVALEDVQWADPSTRELAEGILELTDRAPLALVLTQESIPGSEGAALRLRALSEYGHRTTELALGPLSDTAAEQLLAGALPSNVDATMRARLVREAEGNPLYLEELARAYLEGALEPRGRTWTVNVSGAELLPPALENLLVARIDRLPDDARRVAALAAAIGRTFPVRVLEEVTGTDPGEELATLFRSGIVRELRRYPEFECTFAHRLLQEAALSTLTAARRRDVYRRVAAAFEHAYAGSLDDHLERLAHYHAQGGNLPKALEYAERARHA
jgi:DNA-binding SARP family transcriptional activator